MTNIQAAFLYDQLNDIEHIMHIKKSVFQIYNILLESLIDSGKVKIFVNRTGLSISALSDKLVMDPPQLEVSVPLKSSVAAERALFFGESGYFAFDGPVSVIFVFWQPEGS